MLPKTLRQELEEAVESALVRSEPGAPIQAIAEQLFGAKPALMEQLKRPCIVDRLVWMLNRQRSSIGALDLQLLLPGISGLPRRISLKNGSRPRVQDVGFKDLQEFRRIASRRGRARLKAIEELIEFLRPFERETPGITVAEAAKRKPSRPVERLNPPHR